jgi:mannose-1-phosphate guanylyltransferase / phosphomannomutase
MKMVKTAVIIAGGEGSRLKPLSYNKPKAMVPVNGQPLLYWVIRWLKFHGVENVVIGVAYKKEKILSYMKSRGNLGLNAQFSTHTLEGGTAQGFKLAISRFVEDEDFIAMNCDEITNFNLTRLIRAHRSKQSLVTMALAPFLCRFSVVETGKNRLIKGFKYGHMLKDVPVSIGVYTFNRKILSYIPDTGSIEHAVFTPLARKGKIGYYRLGADEQWISVNDVKNVREVEENPQLLELGPDMGSERKPFHNL